MPRRIAVCMLLASCQLPTEPNTNVMKDVGDSSVVSDATPHADSAVDEIWVCHNPGTKHHGRVCTEHCLVAGDPYAFCWVLDRSYCTEEQPPAWLSGTCEEFAAQ